MKKRFVLIFIAAALLIITLCVASITAAASVYRVCDEADLLTASEESTLASKLDEISERQGCDIVVLTVYDLNGKSPMEYADDYYDYGGYSPSGALLLVSIGSRDWYISTAGYCITAMTDAGLDYMSNQFLGSLSDGDYFDAFNTFAEQCDKFLNQARTGTPYDIGNLPKTVKPLDSKWILYALAIGIALGLFITGSMKNKLKSVYQRSAAAYVRSGSLNLINANEMFLYSNISRTERSDNSSGGGSSTHTSSSGTTHGGSGGKF